MLLLSLGIQVGCSGGKYYSAKYSDCLDSETCARRGLYAYEKIMLCFDVYTPAADGGFIPSTKGVYKCGDG